MRLYHTILFLSALIISINAAFQAAWLFQFSQVRDSVIEFGGNWLPTIRTCGELTRMVGEFRRLELLYVLAQSEQEMAHVARRMGRQETRIRQVDERLATLVRSDGERQAFSSYLATKDAYFSADKAILKAASEGRLAEAMNYARNSAQAYSAMVNDIQAIEHINNEAGQVAALEASQRYDRVIRTMIAAGAASIFIAFAAAFFAAKRISRPIANLADCMDGQDATSPSCKLLPPRGGIREVSQLYGAFRVMTEKLSDSFKKLEDLAVTDQLTGVYNRRRLFEEGNRVLDVCRRGGHPCSVLMLDLDHFKAINDVHGHAVGDEVLRHVASTLGSHIRTSDVLARYGGEEFALIAPNSGLHETQQLAERLRHEVEHHAVSSGGKQIPVTVSIGVAVNGHTDSDLRGLLDQADKALYLANKNGRNRVETLGAPN
ncbi:MAG: diguanylate cyclase [Desulfovibrio sp.]|nr:diguanylate cyclase [Desulfovibrio sp.]